MAIFGNGVVSIVIGVILIIILLIMLFFPYRRE
jgi:hypothetical protein